MGPSITISADTLENFVNIPQAAYASTSRLRRRVLHTIRHPAARDTVPENRRNRASWKIYRVRHVVNFALAHARTYIHTRARACVNYRRFTSSHKDADVVSRKDGARARAHRPAYFGFIRRLIVRVIM